MIRYRVVKTQKKITQICGIGLDYKLFSPTGSMIWMYKKPENITCASIAYLNGRPVGICLKGTSIHSFFDIAVFVNPQHRHQGIGKNLVRKSDHIFRARRPEMTRTMSKGFFVALGY